MSRWPKQKAGDVGLPPSDRMAVAETFQCRG